MKKKEKKVLPPEDVKRCVLYLRFSSENQTEQSIEGPESRTVRNTPRIMASPSSVSMSTEPR